jgi:hypothetical protein
LLVKLLALLAAAILLLPVLAAIATRLVDT